MTCDFLPVWFLTQHKTQRVTLKVAITVGQRFENLKLGKLYILWYLCRISKSMQLKAAHTLTQQLSHDKADPEFPGHLRQCFVMYNTMLWWLKHLKGYLKACVTFWVIITRQGHIKPVNPMCTREDHGFNCHMKYMLNLWDHPMFGCLLHVLKPPSSKEVIIDLLFKFLYQHKIFSSPPMIRW